MHYDLVIVGGGMVGATLAVALAPSELNIALIDAKLPHSDDPRLFALNKSSCDFFKNLGVWPKIKTHASAIRQVHVSRKGHFGAVRLKAEDVDASELGHVVPAKWIEAALNETLTSLPNCTFYRPAQLSSLQQQDHHVQLIIQTEAGEKTLQASLVIGADGTESTVRTQLAIPVDTLDYGQSAIVTRTQLKRAHDNIAYERFEENGTIAMLPLTGNECATIWSGDNDWINTLKTKSDAEFLEILQKTFGYRLGRLQSICKRFCFPLRMVKAEKTVVDKVLLLGNSAHTFHPVAAQGFNLALYEVAVLAEEINKIVMQKETLTMQALQMAEEKTRKQQAASMGVSHRLTQLFSDSFLLKNMLIQVGMSGMDMMAPVKKRFISHLMGKNRNMPKYLMDNDSI